MSDTIRNENDPIVDPHAQHVPPEAVDDAHDADGTMGRVAGTGSGAISGGIVGAAVGGPVGAVIGAVAGAAIGLAGGNAAHKVGDDHDDVNVTTGSGGDLGKNAGAGAGSISGAIVGGAAAGPVGAVAGAVAGGMLGAAAGDGAKDMGGDPDDPDVVPSSYAGSTAGTAGSTPISQIPGAVTGGAIGGGGESASGTTPISQIPGAISGASIGGGTGTGGHDVEGGGHNIVTGEEAQTDAGKTGLGTGAVVGGLIGTAVGGPVGAVVGGALGSVAGGVAGDATEAGTIPGAAGPIGGTQYESTASNFQTAPGYDANLHVGTVGTGPDLRNVSRTDYESMGEDDRMRVQLVKEELHVGKETRETGEVEVSKRVVEEQVQVPVTLQREEVVVTRHAVDRPATGGEVIGEGSETIRVPVHEERAVISKEARVTEEVEIGTRTTSHEQVVSDTVRHEELDVNNPTATTAGLATGVTPGPATGAVGTGTLGTGADLTPGNDIPGVQTGGTTSAGTDTRGVTEKAADALTGDRTDDKTGGRI